MSEQFKPCDVVELKWGGPAMTVDSVNSGQAWCSWFINGARSKDRFPLEALKPCENRAR